jgi:hypothetical protein
LAANLAPGGPFDVPDTPFVLGKKGLRSKTWRAPFTHGLTDAWRERCRLYWEGVEQRFGVVMSERRDAWDEVEGLGPVVVTYAVPIAILKGTRIRRPRPLDEMKPANKLLV